VSWEIRVGDAIEVLRKMPDNSVHCVVTSPPYWGLRDYSACQCSVRRNAGAAALADAGTVKDGVSGQYSPDDPRCKRAADPNCPKCNGTGRIQAVEGKQYGLERTPQEYVANMVEVFREVRRVLRPEGTCWLNIGDCYATGAGKVGNAPGGGEQGARWAGYRGDRSKDNAGKASYRIPDAGVGPMTQPNRMPIEGLKPKDLVGIPWMLAFALRADGWYLRQEIIWNKPNPMPESVTDRCTKSHESIFLLTKSPRYYFDSEAIKEPSVTDDPRRPYTSQGAWQLDGRDESKRHSGEPRESGDFSRRNKRSVWTVATAPFSGAHFATFPPKLIEPCILAGTSEQGCCSSCGAPWERVVEREVEFTSGSGKAGNVPKGKYEGTAQAESGDYDIRMGPSVHTKTLGWKPTCTCYEGGSQPCTVLDPFAGAGTTGLVARRLGRSFVGIELNPEYLEMGTERIVQDAPLFNSVEGA
jgi:DNA modification methylase